MTREEAIKILKAIRVYECYPKSASEETKEAIDMAIETLSAEEPKTGKWIQDDDYICDQCGYHMIVGGGAYNFCPNCGADMKGADHEID